jgi:photosystem II stability/assembly factor-like uncharacterized protein
LTAVLAALAGCAGGDGTGDATYAWCEVYPPAFDSGFAAASFPDPLVGTVVGGIYRTTDGGVSWTSQQGPDGYGSYADVVFTDVNTGTIVGSGGTILRTTDGGKTWVDQASGTSLTLNGVSFIDADNGMVVGVEGLILRTTDGGETWIEQESGTDAPLYGVWLSDAMTTTVVGGFGTILRTTDGGAAWVAQDGGGELWLNAVSFGSATTGVAVSRDGAYLRTTDGGAMWTQSDEYRPVPLNDVFFANANVGTIVGASGTILRTTDGGASWAYELSDAAYWHWDTLGSDPVRVGKTFNGVSMADAVNGVAAGGTASVVRRMPVPDNYRVCDPWCVKFEECYPGDAFGCDIDCLCNLRYHYNIRPECEQAVVESQRCFSALTCEQVDAWWDNPDNHPCTAAERKIDVACADEPMGAESEGS